MSSVSARVRALVVERDEGRCVRCGVQLFDDGRPVRQYSLQHRRARGMGGSKAGDTNGPQNLILVCGHATGGGWGVQGSGCHHLMESRNSAGWERGWWIKQGENPLEIPVSTWRGRVWLDADGGWRHVTDEGREPTATNPFTGETEAVPW